MRLLDIILVAFTGAKGILGFYNYKPMSPKQLQKEMNKKFPARNDRQSIAGDFNKVHSDLTKAYNALILEYGKKES